MAADGWSATWPEKGSRSAVTVSDTSCAEWACGRNTRNPITRFPAILQSVIPAWWIARRSRRLIRCEPLTSHTSHCRKASCIWSRSYISFLGMFSAGSCPTALTRKFCLEALETALSSGRRPQIYHFRPMVQVKLNRPRVSAAGKGDQDQLVRKEALLHHPGRKALAHRQIRGVCIHTYSDGWEAEITRARVLWKY